MAYDILIKSGTVFDGVGDSGQKTDIAIEGDTIAAVGDLGTVAADTVINATGQYVTPGFIDITNHSDTHLTLFKYPMLESMVLQGVTTIIGGNCGASLAPLASRNAIGAVSKWADLSEISVDWNTVGEFLTTMERLGLGANFGTCIGYGTIRRGVSIEGSAPLDATQLQQARLLLREGIKEGAFGLSLGLAYGHERVASTEELSEVLKILQETGAMLKIHLRSEGSKLFAAINEAVQFAEEFHIPVQISHLKAIGKKAWQEFDDVLKLLEQAQGRGANIHFDTTTYSTTGSPLYLLLPDWAREGGFRGLFERMSDPVMKQKIVESVKSYTLHYDRVIVISAKIKAIVGKTLAEIAADAGLSPEEALLETLRANDGRVTIIGRTLRRINTRRAVEHPLSYIASDGEGYQINAAGAGNLVHPRSFGNFARFWHWYVEKETIIQPAAAIEKMTSGPAGKLGLKNRGTLQKGWKADIAIFDPKTFRDTATYRDPFHYAAGMDSVLINGVIVVEHGQHRGIKAGRVIRRG